MTRANSNETTRNCPEPYVNVRPLSVVSLTPCATTASVGSATSPNGSVVAREQVTETPGSAVRVRPSPAWRVIDSFRRASSSTPQVNHAGTRSLPRLTGSCKSQAVSL